MASDDNVTLAQLTEAANIAINPSVTQEERNKAYRICEGFKETSSSCITYGIELSKVSNPPNIRHFGLQLLEHTVKFRWNKSSITDKVLVKESVMNLLACGTNSILEEETYIKDGLAKIVVEMVKREWPQQWPSFMNELHELCKQGETQSELVMLILLRLVEDVIAFQNISQIQRRREILQAVNSEMESLLIFMKELLKHYTEKMKLKKEEGNLSQAQAACKVADKVLLTLSCFVEWAPSQHIFSDNNSLLCMLYLLLAEPQLRLRTAECLQLIVSWKGKIEDRVPLLILLSEDAVSRIFEAAELVSRPEADEASYVFLKLLCQVMTGLMSQLCAIWGSNVAGFQVPANLNQCLQTLWAFTSHHSVHVCHMTLTTWLSLLRHQHFSKHQALSDIEPVLLQVFTKTLQKVGMPSRNDHPSCHFSKMDFDNDDEFLQFFAIHRSHQVDIIRKIATHNPSLAFDAAGEWLLQLLLAPLELEEGATMCTHHSPSWHHWDALTSFMDSVMMKVLVIDDSLNRKALKLLHSALDADIKDPLILSCVLTCVSALFPSLKEDIQHVKKVLDKLFAAAVYSLPGQTKTRTRPVQNVRRHAICGLIRMCLDHPELMVPFFDEIHMKTRELMIDPEQLTKLEKVNLYETLILISNEFKDFSRQSTLIKEVLEPVSSVWVSDFTKQMIFPADAFLHHVGLDAFPTSPTQEEALGSNRAHITTCLTHILAVMKRSCVPKNIQEAKNGGFVKGCLADGRPILMNPSAPHVMPMLQHALMLSWTLNTIWTPDVQAKVCPEYKKAFEIPEMEKHAILGASPSFADGLELPANRPMAEKTQSFLHNIHDQLCHIFATACQCLGYEFYSPNGICNMMMETVFNNIEFLPNFKLRNIIRVVLKHLVKYCPQECYTSHLIPILKRMCRLMFERLSQEWSAQASGAEPGSDQEAEEILADHLLCLITRDYLELLRLVLIRKDAGDTVESSIEMDVEEEQKPTANSSETEQMGTLGISAIQDEELCQSILLFVYSAMSWNDSLTSIRSAFLAGILLPQIMEKHLLPEAAAQLFTAILKGLSVHGQYEAVKNPLIMRGLQHYEMMRPKFESVETVLRDLPDANGSEIDLFLKRYICKNPNVKSPTEKKKKEAFKKLVAGVISKPVGQMFRREVHIKNLPKLYKPTKLKPSVIDTATSSEDLALVSLFAN
ncbi:exportin-5-like isoform X2 [Apostichopus japonicus]|uniref:exportin-5-like isoform X2 n=1 Tax=Stichopus japonicus TaxID=307972 RepID=UPI003AB6265A